ncbi:unnamed protein product [Orchesella dallaii]|uniref:DH domain-containing protein n=1 Tax=Orchesella dallaii TaxID=48710 RepID=A0ABP1QRR4_9HEXA
MSCESSITDLTMEMFEEDDCKDQLLSHIKELHEAVTAMKSAFTEAQQQLEGVQGDDGKMKEEIESTKTQCQQQSSEILRLILNLQTEMGSVKEMVKTTQLLQHGMQSAIHTLLLDRDFLLDELAKNGAISETVRGRLHTRLNGYIARPSSGSQSTNDSGVALLGENGSNKSSTTGSQNNHATLSASVSNDNNGSNQLLLHHHGLGSSSPVGGGPYLNPTGGNANNNGGGGNQFQDSLPVSEHHLLNHHLPLGPPHHHHMVNPHVQEYLNTHHQLHQQHQLRALYQLAHHNGEMVAASGAGAPGGGGCNQSGVMAGCCYPTIPPPPPLTYATEVGPGGIVYDSDSSLTLAAAKSLSLSNSLSKQCGLELDHQQQQIMLDDENKSKKGTRRNSSSNESSSFKDAVKCSSGRTCDVTGGGGGGVSGGASGSSGDPSCYNSDAELVLTDDSNPSGILKYNGHSSVASSSASMMSFKENQRMKVAKELMDTERKYCHTLKTIQETFALPLKNSGILSMKDINTLFPEEVFKLYEKHCGLLGLLEDRLATWKNKPTVGDLLERFINGEDANVLRLYTSYVNDFPEVLKTFHKLCRSSTDFTRFLKSTLEHPTCGGLDLGAFLLTPVQRMPRYILLLKQMMKFTDVGHPDYNNISICLDRLREYLKRLNDSMEHSFQLVTAQISPQPHEPLLEKLMGFSGKNAFPRASTSSQSSTGGEHEHHQQQVVHKVRYKRSTSVPRSSHSSTSETGPKSMPAGGGTQKESKSKLKSRSKSDWAVCNNNGVSGSKNSIIQEDVGGSKRCMSCNCAGGNSSGNVQKLPGACGGDPRAQHHHSRFKGKKNVFERTLSDSDINSDGDEGSLVEDPEQNGRKFSTSKSLHDFNQDDEEGNLDWFISEPSLCEIKHGGVVRHDVVVTPDEESGRSRASSSLRRNMMIRPMTTNPSGGRVIARLQRASESEMNLHMLEKSAEVKEKAGKGSKGKMSLRNSLKNIFSIKKRYRSGGKSRSENSTNFTSTTASTSTTSTTISTATATANYRVVYTADGSSHNSEQRVALLKNASHLPSCLVSAGTSFTASTTNINNICSSATTTSTNTSSSHNNLCSSELKALGISPLLQYLHRMPSYLELIMFSVRETTV